MGTNHIVIVNLRGLKDLVEVHHRQPVASQLPDQFRRQRPGRFEPLVKQVRPNHRQIVQHVERNARKHRPTTKERLQSLHGRFDGLLPATFVRLKTFRFAFYKIIGYTY